MRRTELLLWLALVNLLFFVPTILLTLNKSFSEGLNIALDLLPAYVPLSCYIFMALHVLKMDLKEEHSFNILWVKEKVIKPYYLFVVKEQKAIFLWAIFWLGLVAFHIKAFYEVIIK